MCWSEVDVRGAPLDRACFIAVATAHNTEHYSGRQILSPKSRLWNGVDNGSHSSWGRDAVESR